MMVDGDHKVTEKTQNVIEKAPSISSISSQQTTGKLLFLLKKIQLV